jgi:hypothetical protein
MDSRRDNITTRPCWSAAGIAADQIEAYKFLLARAVATGIPYDSQPSASIEAPTPAEEMQRRDGSAGGGGSRTCGRVQGERGRCDLMVSGGWSGAVRRTSAGRAA